MTTEVCFFMNSTWLLVAIYINSYHAYMGFTTELSKIPEVLKSGREERSLQSGTY